MYSRLFSGLGTARNFSSTWCWSSLLVAVKPRIGALVWVRGVDGTTRRQSAATAPRRITHLLYRPVRASRGYRIPVSKWRSTVVAPLGPTITSFACALGDMRGASGFGTTTYLPGATSTSKCPWASERKEAPHRPACCTGTPALKSTSHG